jgi:S-formylglutathione hydrolase FrmB
MAGPLEWSLLSGALPTVLVVCAVVGFGFLLVRRPRRWRLVVVPAVALGSVLGAWLLDRVVEDWWRPFPDALPSLAVVWIGIVLAGFGLAIGHFSHSRWWRKLAALVAALAVLAAGSNEINRFYGYYPNVATVIGLAPPQQAPLPPVQSWAAHGSTQRIQAGPSLNRWRPPRDMPTTGVVSEVDIPGVRSKFAARHGWVYLPPAYLTARRPLLPVMILLAGQPGAPRDWINAGRVIATMDAFAAAHGGLAPVVVMPDPLGAALANPLCMNSRLGNADTYLSIDVPAWILSHLQVTPNHQYWAVGGFSNGGTCALQLAVYHPSIFPNFLDIAGPATPSLGSPSRTIDRAFGGDRAAYHRAEPLTELEKVAKMRPDGHRQAVYRHSFGVLTSGTVDPVSGLDPARVYAAGSAAGMTLRLLNLPGGHRWPIAGIALRDSLPLLAPKLGLSFGTTPRVPTTPPKSVKRISGSTRHSVRLLNQLDARTVRPKWASGRIHPAARHGGVLGHLSR